jgi:hypothetical protein
MTCNGSCEQEMCFEKANSYVDKYAWRCHVKHCSNYRKRMSIRIGSVFENFNTN